MSGIIDGDHIHNGDVAFLGQSHGEFANTETPSGTTETVDWNNGINQAIDLGSATGDVTVTLSHPKTGAWYTLKIIQDDTTPRNIAWPGTVLWPGGSTPTISVGASAIDLVKLYYDGSNYLANILQDYS